MTSVRELILKRALEKSTPRKRSDDFHVALVVEGGGMRGVVAGGMVSGLEERGLVDCFDSVHGASAGACAGAYFLAGQAALGTSIYYEDINNKDFINCARFASLKPVMNTSFLINHVMRLVKVLDVAKIIAQPGRLSIVATDVDSAEPATFLRFNDVDDFFLILRASITIPLIAGRWVHARGRRLVDGGMTQQIALKSALENGATHVLVLMTHRAQELMRPATAEAVDIERWLINAVYGSALAECYRKRNGSINMTIRTILDRAIEGVAIDYVVRPPESVYLNRLCKDTGILRTADMQSREVIHRYFDARYAYALQYS